MFRLSNFIFCKVLLGADSTHVLETGTGFLHATDTQPTVSKHRRGLQNRQAVVILIPWTQAVAAADILTTSDPSSQVAADTGPHMQLRLNNITDIHHYHQY